MTRITRWAADRATLTRGQGRLTSTPEVNTLTRWRRTARSGGPGERGSVGGGGISEGALTEWVV